MKLTKEEKLNQDVINKAWEDEAFKNELIANPVDAIEKLTGVRLQFPEGKTLVVRDQTDQSTIYINIPEEKNMDVELNEEQLETVAGGLSMVPIHDQFFPKFPPIGCFPLPPYPGDPIKPADPTR